MISGMIAAIFWAVETLLLSVALTHGGLTELGSFQAAFLTAGLHDFFSACYLLSMLAVTGRKTELKTAFQSVGGKKIQVAAIFGGPVGMLCYLIAVEKTGVSVATAVSALYPAIGAVFSFCFLKERLRYYQCFSILLSVLGAILLGLGTGGNSILLIGFLFAFICAVSWGMEAVISSSGMKKSNLSFETALTIRQITSACIYLVLLGIGLLTGRLDFYFSFKDVGIRITLIAAFFGTLSYLFYYRTIRKIGASKAMVLNITYTVWVIVFESIMKKRMPDYVTMICAVLIAIGSVFSTYEWQKFKGDENNEKEFTTI